MNTSERQKTARKQTCESRDAADRRAEKLRLRFSNVPDPSVAEQGGGERCAMTLPTPRSVPGFSKARVKDEPTILDT